MNTTQTLLLAARTLIANPQHFSRGRLARDYKGTPLNETQLNTATRFCTFGAILFQDMGSRTNKIAINRLNEAARSLGYKSFTGLNNSGGHAKTLKMFDRAIELAGKQRVR